MPIALIGYGKMGQALESEILTRGLDAPVIIRSLDDPNWEMLKQCQSAIEFTRPEAAKFNLLRCFKAGVPVVCGTTGWYHDFEEIKAACLAEHAGLFYATNFSIGVHLFFQIARETARRMQAHPDYRVSIEEIHHTQKKDHPSGTALTLAQHVMSELHQYTQVDPFLEPPAGQPMPHAPHLPVLCYREGDVPGTHTLRFENNIDRIDLKHEAFGRRGFASGAVDAAIWMAGRKGLFTMDDMLG